MRISQARTLPIVIFTAALIFRSLTAALLLHDHGSTLFYHQNEPSHIAANVAAGAGFSAPYERVPIAPTAQQPPLYPVLLAGIFRIFGSFTFLSLCVLLAIHSFAGATTAVLIYVGGSRYFTRSVGLLAACFWAFWPFESLFDLPVGNYGLSALAVSLWFVTAQQVLAISSKNRDWIFLGIGAGTVLLLNPALAVVLLASGAWIRWREHIDRKLFLAATVLLLTLAPWTVRNYIVFHRFVPLRDNFGLELYLGNHPNMAGEVEFDDDFPSHNPRLYSQLGEIPYMDLKHSQATEFIRRYPIGFAKRVAKRFIDFWIDPGIIPWGIISILAWVDTGVALMDSSRRRMGIFLSLSFFFFPMLYCITHFWTLYRHPAEPLILLAAFSTIHNLYDAVSKRSKAAELFPFTQSEPSVR